MCSIFRRSEPRLLSPYMLTQREIDRKNPTQIHSKKNLKKKGKKPPKPNKKQQNTTHTRGGQKSRRKTFHFYSSRVGFTLSHARPLYNYYNYWYPASNFEAFCLDQITFDLAGHDTISRNHMPLCIVSRKHSFAFNSPLSTAFTPSDCLLPPTQRSDNLTLTLLFCTKGSQNARYPR